MQYDAIVIGAGLAGSTVAILLARAGWSVAVVEKKRFPRRKVCGECIAASNLPLLDALGVGHSVARTAGKALQHVALLHGQRKIRADLPRAAHAHFPWGYAVGRESLDTLLLDAARAAGAEVLQPWQVQGMTGAPGAWRCRVRCVESGERRALHSGVLIDAHGSWETLAGQRADAGSRVPADAAAEKVPRRDHDLLAFKASFVDTAHREGVISVLALNGGYGGMVVGAAGVTTLACCIRRDRLDALRRAHPGARAGLAVEQWLQAENQGVNAVLKGASRMGPWLASGPLRPGIRLSRNDRVLRVGNAAGEAHPILGEGMSMALQSAALLCRQLLRHDPVAFGPAGGPVDGTVDGPVSGPGADTGGDMTARVAGRYAAAWQAEFPQRLRLAAGFAHIAMRSPSARALMVLATIWPQLLTRGARWGGKTRLAIDPADPGLLREHLT